MPARRFFLEGTHANGDVVAIAGSDARKIVRVLRLRNGDRIEAVDSAARVFEAALAIEGESVTAHLGDGRAHEETGVVRIEVAQSLPKGQKMDFVVEKLTELGVSRILPLETERSVARGPGAQKLERWRRLAKAAAAQSGRREIPEIAAPRAFADLLQCFSSYDVVLFPWELAPAVSLAARLPAILRGARSVLLAIGPEGGFSHAEADAAAANGAELISLGPRILRTETAALALVAVLVYLGAQ